MTVRDDEPMQLRAVLAVEHQHGGSFQAWLPQQPIPLPLRDGDHLWLNVEAPADAWLTGVLEWKQQ